MAQGSGDLGVRMRRVFETMPSGDVLVVGADIPAIDASAVWGGFEALKGADAVFGPAPDGGYWTVGLACNHRKSASFLKNVRWSSAFALEDSINSLGGQKRVAMTQPLDDVDTGQDLAALNKAARG